MKKVITAIVACLWMMQTIAQTTFNVNDKIEAEENGKWFKATVLKVENGKYFIHWDGYSTSYDAWIAPERTRAIGGASTSTATSNTTTTNTGTTTATSGSTNTNSSNYLSGEALTKFKQDMIPFNPAVATFCIYLNPKPYGLGGTSYPDSKNIGTWLAKINELEAFLKANYPNNCNSSPEMEARRDYYDFKDQPSVYREVCEKKIQIVQAVLNYESIDESWNRRWISEYASMQTNVSSQQYMFNDYLHYLVFPAHYEQEKAKHREKFEAIYAGVGVPYDQKTIFAVQDSMLQVYKKYVDENIANCPLSAWKVEGYYPFQNSTFTKMVTDRLLQDEPQAKIIGIYYDEAALYKVYDESYYPAKLTGKQLEGMVAYTLPYTNYVYTSIFTLVQDYDGGAFSSTHFMTGDSFMYFNGVCSNQ
jgi:hypothetical protein